MNVHRWTVVAALLSAACSGGGAESPDEAQEDALLGRTSVAFSCSMTGTLEHESSAVSLTGKLDTSGGDGPVLKALTLRRSLVHGASQEVVDESKVPTAYENTQRRMTAYPKMKAFDIVREYDFATPVPLPRGEYSAHLLPAPTYALDRVDLTCRRQ